MKIGRVVINGPVGVLRVDDIGDRKTKGLGELGGVEIFRARRAKSAGEGGDEISSAADGVQAVFVDNPAVPAVAWTKFLLAEKGGDLGVVGADEVGQ